MSIELQCVSAYRKHRHLGMAAREIGIPWQTLYVHLRNVNEPVAGDKEKYGSETDRFAAKIEKHFKTLVPKAEDNNKTKFQSKYDFDVCGLNVDVKAARPVRSSKMTKAKRWAWSVRKQESSADFFVCFGCDESGKPLKCLLIPGEIARNYISISLSLNGGKWGEYEIAEGDLSAFFDSASF